MKGETRPVAGESAATIDKRQNFISALFRVVQCGIYYPFGHIGLDQTVSKCLHQLQQQGSPGTAVTIALSTERITVNEQELPATSATGGVVRNMLAAVGIKSITIEWAIGHNEFRRFVLAILKLRKAMAEGATGDDCTIEPPARITIEWQGRQDSDGPPDSDGNLSCQNQLDGLVNGLQNQGFDAGQAEKCRLLLARFFTEKEQRLQVAGYPYITRGDIRRLLLKVILTRYLPVEGRFDVSAAADLEVLVAIFHSLERDLHNRGEKEAVNLLVSHLTGRKKYRYAPVKVATARPRANQAATDRKNAEQIPLGVLKAFVKDNQLSTEIREQIPHTDRSSELSIYLQLLGDELEPRLQDNLEKNLLAILVGELSDREKSVLMGGIRYFLDKQRFAAFQRLMEMVVHLLRQSSTLPSLLFLVELWSRMPHAMHTRLWPYVVNELLVTGAGDEPVYLEALEIAAHLPLATMRVLQGELETMDGCKFKKLADDFIFSPGYVYGYHLFGFLLETTIGDLLGPRIIAGLQRDPQEQLAQVMAPILNYERPGHSRFLHDYLIRPQKSALARELRVAAGELILEYLEGVSDEEKQQPVVVSLISALEEYHCDGVLESLADIVQEKKLGIVPIWPRECRIAAERVQLALQRREPEILLAGRGGLSRHHRKNAAGSRKKGR